MELKILRSQRGAALMIGVLAVSAGLLVLGGALGNQLMGLNDDLARQKLVDAGGQAMRDFATLAVKAHQTFEANGGTCPTGTTALLSGRPFCWPTASANRCIRDPLSSLSATAPRTLCLLNSNSTASGDWLVISRLDDRPWLARAKDTLVAQMRRAVTTLDSVANAQSTGQGYANRPPVVGSAPAYTNRIAVSAASVKCSGAGTPPYGSNCRICNNPTQPCLTLKICMKAAGTCTGPEYLEQSILILPRS